MRPQTRDGGVRHLGPLSRVGMVWRLFQSPARSIIRATDGALVAPARRQFVGQRELADVVKKSSSSWTAVSNALIPSFRVRWSSRSRSK